MRTLVFALLFTFPLLADVLTDVRGALTTLKATEPILATYELEQSGTSEGKLDNDKFSGKVSVDLEGGGGGFRVIVPQALLEQMEREQQVELRNSQQKSRTVRTLNSINPVDTSEAIDFAPVLLRLIEGAKVVAEGSGTWGGKPARTVVIRVLDRMDPDDAKKMKIAENKLTLWLGADHVPLAAEHVRVAKFSFLIFRWEMRDKQSWHLGRVADRLVRLRYEQQQSGSGMGQKNSETTVATLRVR